MSSKGSTGHFSPEHAAQEAAAATAYNHSINNLLPFLFSEVDTADETAPPEAAAAAAAHPESPQVVEVEAAGAP